MSLGGLAWYMASRGQARNARINYGAVLGLPPDHPEVGRLARRAFEQYGQMLADFLLIASLSREELFQRMHIDGLDHLDRALAEGRGCVVAIPHLGSWDMGGAVGGLLGYPVVTVADRFPGSLNDAVARARSRMGLNILHPGRHVVPRLLEALATNHLVCLVCDLPHGPGIEVEFLEHRATVPSGPAALALKTGAPLLTAHFPRTAPGHYVGLVDGPLARSSSGDRRLDALALTQAIVRRFETYIRRWPDQWYAFRPLLSARKEPAAVAV